MQKGKKGYFNKAKFDYDSEEFHDKLRTLAMQGATDGEIGGALEEITGESISYTTFSSMLNGHYRGWTEEENERRSKAMARTLENARYGLTRIVRGRFLKCALGGVEVKTTTVVRRKLRIDGVYTDDEEVQTTTTTSETAPNVGALQTWLNHYDPVWRKVSRGEDDDDTVKKAKKGIDIGQWIRMETSQEQ